jgi:c-di-GMP-binding flagellar brake protein YcgR
MINRMRTPKPILDRRRSIRIQEVLPFTIGHEGFELEAHTVNISAHGAMCLISKDIPIMTQLKIALKVPQFGKANGTAKAAKTKMTTIHAKGVVVRKEKDPVSGKYFLAVFFSDMNEKDRQLFKEYIEHRLAE